MSETDSGERGDNEFQLIEPTPEAIESFLTSSEERGLEIELAVVKIPGPTERGSVTLSVELRNEDEVTMVDPEEYR